MILYYELGEFDLLAYRVASLRRLLQRRASLHRFEEIFLLYLRRLPNLADSSAVCEWFGQLHDELLPLRDALLDRQAFDDFPYLAWLKSKTNGTCFAEEVRQEYQERTEQYAEV